MSKVPHVGDLQVDQDLGFQRREWTAQRVGWAVMALVALAGLAGVFGKGPVARGTAAGADGSLRLEYERLTRKHAPGSMEFQVGPNVAVDDTIQLWIDRRLLETLEIREITPEPAGVDAAEDGYIYNFTVADRGAAATIRFDVEPDKAGFTRGRIGLVGRQALTVSQLVYP